MASMLTLCPIENDLSLNQSNSTLQITVQNISSAPHEVTNTTVYTILFVSEYHTWTVMKRYSDFYEWNNRLVCGSDMDLVINSLPKLPPKRWLKNSEAIVIERKIGFKHYLNALWRREDSLNNQIFRDFIEIDEWPGFDSQGPSPYAKTENKIKKCVTLPNISVEKGNVFSNGCLPILANDSYKYIQNWPGNIYTNLYSHFSKLRNSPEYDIYPPMNHYPPWNEGNMFIISEFLRTLREHPESIFHTVHSFSKFFEEQINSDNCEALSPLEIEYLYTGELRLIPNKLTKPNKSSKSNGVLYYIGRCTDNKIGSEACLVLMLKLWSYETNYDYEKYISVLKNLDIKYLVQMHLCSLVNLHNYTSLNEKAYKMLLVLYNNHFELQKIFSFNDYEIIICKWNKVIVN